MVRCLVVAMVLWLGTGQNQLICAQPSMPALEVSLMEGGATGTRSLAGARGTVLVFWSNECNWTQQYERRVMAMAGSADGVAVVLVNSNDAQAFPSEAEGNDMGLPYVRDDTGALAKALGAERTPHVFAFDAGNTLVYSGAIDDAAADPDAVENAYLGDVLQQLSGGQSVTVASTRPFGCRIKLAS